MGSGTASCASATSRCTPSSVGHPLVLIHGFPQTWWEWRQMMPQLATRHTGVAVDLRGAGHSDKPQGGYDKASLSGDVHGLMTALGFDQYAVCGHDIGAMTALALALTPRDAVTRLTVLDTSQPGWSRWVANSHEQKVWHFAFHMKRDLPELLIRGREFDYVSTFIFDRAFDLGAHPVADIEEFARSLAQPGNLRGGLEWYRAFPVDHENALAWKREPLTIPVLALGGDPPAVPRRWAFALFAVEGRIRPARQFLCRAGLRGDPAYPRKFQDCGPSA
jgi:pimeloyl-ACP methyl ester carboxylesterase